MNGLQLYYELIKEMYIRNINLGKQIQLNIVKQYGYQSLQEAKDFVKISTTKNKSI